MKLLGDIHVRLNEAVEAILMEILTTNPGNGDQVVKIVERHLNIKGLPVWEDVLVTDLTEFLSVYLVAMGIAGEDRGFVNAIDAVWEAIATKDRTKLIRLVDDKQILLLAQQPMSEEALNNLNFYQRFMRAALRLMVRKQASEVAYTRTFARNFSEN